jgi:sulfate permease, SulP family
MTRVSSWLHRPLVRRLLPFLAWRHRVDRASLRADLAAGLTCGLILVPQGVAFATIAGLPPEYGLYAAMVPVVVAALFGSSWHMVGGPTTAISVVVFSTLSPLADPGSPEFVQLALTLAFLTGVVMLALGGLRLGGLMNFVSHTVVVGFTAGAAVLIAASQLKNFLGLPIPRGANLEQSLQVLVEEWAQINPWVASVAAFTLIASILARRYLPKVPHMITALVAGSVLAAALNHWLGAARTGIASIGALPFGLPPLSAPDLAIESIRQVLPIAIAVAMLSLTEAMSIARALALKTEQRLDSNQEFIGQGLSNIAGAFFSAYPSSGSFNRSGLNLESGARTPLAAVFSALLLVVMLQLVAPLATYLPLPAMAGVLFLVAWGLIDFAQVRHILRSSRQESVVLATTFGATLLMDLQFAIYVGVLLSLLLYLNRTSRPVVEDVKRSPGEGHYHFSDDTGLPDCPQLKILRVNGSLFFGAVDHVQQKMLQVDIDEPRQKHLLLVCPGVNFIDLAGGQMLAQEARRRRRLGGDLYVLALRSQGRKALRDSGYEESIGIDHFFEVGAADPMDTIVPKLDPAICAGCTRRIFRQCASQPGPPTASSPDAPSRQG